MRAPSRLLVVGAFLLAAPARAQTLAPTGAVGVLVPRGSLGERFRPGGVVGGGVVVSPRGRAWQLQFLGEYWRLPAAAPTPPVTLPRPTLHVTQWLLLSRIGATTGRVRPGVVVGLGQAYLHQRGRTNPYGLVWTATAGAGLTLPLDAGRLVALETRLHAILSDYAVEEYSFATALPIQLRVEF